MLWVLEHPSPTGSSCRQWVRRQQAHPPSCTAMCFALLALHGRARSPLDSVINAGSHFGSARRCSQSSRIHKQCMRQLTAQRR